MKRIAKLSWLEMKMYMRHSVAVWWTFLLPVFAIIGTGLLLDEATKEYYSPILIPGLCVTTLMSTSVLGLLVCLVEAREARLYEVLDLLRMKPLEIMIASGVSRGVLSFFQIVLILVIGVIFHPVYEINELAQNIHLIAITIFLGELVLFQLCGLLTTTVKTGTGANAIGTVVFYVFVIFGGCYYEVSAWPRKLTWFCYYLPSFHLTELFGGIIGRNYYPIESVIVLTVYVIVFLVLNILCLDWRHKYV